MRRLAVSLALLSTACTSDAVVTLLEVDGSGTHGSVLLHEAITKSFSIRVDAFVEVAGDVEGMTAGFAKGSCTSPGPILQVLGVHEAGQGGAADVVLAEGRLPDLEGHAIHVFAGSPETGRRIACAELR